MAQGAWRQEGALVVGQDEGRQESGDDCTLLMVSGRGAYC